MGRIHLYIHLYACPVHVNSSEGTSRPGETLAFTARSTNVKRVTVSLQATEPERLNDTEIDNTSLTHQLNRAEQLILSGSTDSFLLQFTAKVWIR